MLVELGMGTPPQFTLSHPSHAEPCIREGETLMGMMLFPWLVSYWFQLSSDREVCACVCVYLAVITGTPVSEAVAVL